MYQLLKSVGHSSMALFQIAGPYLDNPADQSWRALMEVDRTQHKVALDTLASLDMEPSWRDNVRIILTNNIAFIEAALAKGVIAASSRAGSTCWGRTVMLAAYYQMHAVGDIYLQPTVTYIPNPGQSRSFSPATAITMQVTILF